jgi:hypothetical protein
MQPGSQCLSELNSPLEDPADERVWGRSVSGHKHLAKMGKISMSYLPTVGIATLFVNNRGSHDPGDAEDGL